MQLEWNVILTQAIGFIIVVLLLKKYAWGKLIDFIDKRSQKIASSFDEIEQTKAEAERVRGELETEFSHIEATRRSKIQEAAHEANKLASDIKEEARKEAVALRQKTNQDIQLELDKANVALRDRMVNAVVVATEKVIRERLDSDKHKKLIADFLEEVSVKESH
jgi:F-type H+-transporting ATPase subunit b